MTSYKAPVGWQAVIRYAEDYSSALIVLHTFRASPNNLSIPLLPAEKWKVTQSFAEKSIIAAADNSEFTVHGLTDFTGGVFLLTG